MEPQNPSAPGSTPPNTVAAELAAACERFVLARYAVALDGTPETLSLLDQYVRDARPEVKERPETLPLVQGAVGAYFGEVVRKAYPAHWVTEGEQDGWRLDFAAVYLTFNPVGAAREALLGAEAEGWHAHFEVDEAEQEAIAERLAALGSVDDEEYFLPSTRFDVLESVVHALRASMHARGLNGVTFGSDDYEPLKARPRQPPPRR